MAGQFLVYSLEHLVVAQRFDPAAAEFSGVPVTLADDVRIDERSRGLAFSVSAVPPVLAFQRDKDGSLNLTRGWPALLEGK